MKNNKWPRHTLLLIAVIATWLQTYYTYRTAFDLDIENGMQEFILLINPLAFLLGVYGISLFFKSAKGRNAYIITVKVILTIVLYGNVVFYRFYNDFITLPVLFQTNNFGDLGSSVAGLVSLADMLYFADLLIVIAAVLFLPAAKDFNRMANNRRNTYFALTFALLFLLVVTLLFAFVVVFLLVVTLLFALVLLFMLAFCCVVACWLFVDALFALPLLATNIASFSNLIICPVFAFTSTSYS